MGYTRRSIGLSAIGGILIATIMITSTYTYFAYGSGRLVILVKDPPNWGDATHVYIRVGEIKIHRTNQTDETGWITVLENPGWMNLTEVLDTSKIIGEAGLQAGTYNIIRLQVLEAKVTVNGENRTADVPSGKLQVVITHGGVTVSAGQTSMLLIDFETRVTYAPGRGYKVLPKVMAIPVGE
ncbi:MAG: DUF4382 domain-containing protein [Candidatus Bathyarchaeota archaeon]|nr:DUF4382 domain-containing protein [Candidatus Bathyarchaeota archaeon]